MKEEIDCVSCDDGVVWWSDESAPQELGGIGTPDDLHAIPCGGTLGDSGISTTWTCAACGRECSSDGAHHCTHATYGPVYAT